MTTSIQWLYAQQGGKCFYCTTTMAPLNVAGQVNQLRTTPTFDHIILKSNGGKANTNNGVCACRVCNQLRGEINFDVFRSVVINIDSRNKLGRQRHGLRKQNKWVMLYPRCTLTVRPDDATINVTQIKVPQVSNGKRKSRRVALVKKMYKIQASQGGKCACCKQFTLDYSRLYDDITPKEYMTHPFRPMKVKNTILCGTCFSKRKETKPNRWLTFFKNLL